MLEHIIIRPHGGLCNRMRAIASARRICTHSGALCTVCWDWGNYSDFFNVEPDTQWISQVAPDVEKDHFLIKHLLARQGGSYENRKIPTGRHAKILVDSHFVFGTVEDKKAINENHLRKWLPNPTDVVLKKVHQFKSENFLKTVGFHIRRTDNSWAKEKSTDDLFIEQAERLIGQGYKIFLATDNDETTTMMTGRFGNNIIIYPKNPAILKRWPRKFSFEETVADLVDLHLLASCEFVVGSFGSSFSRLAKVLNGSSKCILLTKAET